MRPTPKVKVCPLIEVWPLTDAETAAAAKARRAFSEKPDCPAHISLGRLDAAAEATAYLKSSRAYAVHPPSHCVAAYDALRQWLLCQLLTQARLRQPSACP